MIWQVTRSVMIAAPPTRSKINPAGVKSYAATPRMDAEPGVGQTAAKTGTTPLRSWNMLARVRDIEILKLLTLHVFCQIKILKPLIPLAFRQTEILQTPLYLYLLNTVRPDDIET